MQEHGINYDAPRSIEQGKHQCKLICIAKESAHQIGSFASIENGGNHMGLLDSAGTPSRVEMIFYCGGHQLSIPSEIFISHTKIVITEDSFDQSGSCPRAIIAAINWMTDLNRLGSGTGIDEFNLRIYTNSGKYPPGN